MKNKTYYNNLNSQKEYLIRCFDSLLKDYRELQDYFVRTKSPEDAEHFFYIIKKAEWCQMWNEWEFGRGYRTLKQRMEENRKERNEIVEKIRGIKDLMQTYQREITQ